MGYDQKGTKFPDSHPHAPPVAITSSCEARFLKEKTNSWKGGICSNI